MTPKTSIQSSKASRQSKKPVLKSVGRIAKKSAVKSRRLPSDWVAREKQYAKIFGSLFPQGKLLNADGESITSLVAAHEKFCVRQSAPQPNRMGWIYVSHGLSQSRVRKFNQKQRMELLLHWKERDTQAPVRVLTQFAQYLLTTGNGLSFGQIITADEKLDLADSGFKHWLICPPEQSMPAFIADVGGKVNFVLLLGICEDELQSALRVKPEIADGRNVLFEALKAGGIFPLRRRRKIS
ncbi:MAG: suppressor of fused domain protein [Planctomycetota bacterium]